MSKRKMIELDKATWQMVVDRAEVENKKITEMTRHMVFTYIDNIAEVEHEKTVEMARDMVLTYLDKVEK